MALPWLMPAAFECPVVIGDQGGNRTPDTRITNPLTDVDSDFTLLLNTSDKKKIQQKRPALLLASCLQVR